MKTMAELTDENFDRTIAAAATPVVVDFYAPWCGPCNMIAPLLEQLAQHYAGRIQFFKVNVDDGLELAARFGITGVPTLLLFQGGEVRDAIAGLLPPRELVARMESLVNQRTTIPA